MNKKVLIISGVVIAVIAIIILVVFLVTRESVDNRDLVATRDSAGVIETVRITFDRRGEIEAGRISREFPTVEEAEASYNILRLAHEDISLTGRTVERAATEDYIAERQREERGLRETIKEEYMRAGWTVED
ncbi:MAG: hypothetical protein FWC79_07365 [Oscillospiraceae bacterium]|nr:hypothetical protein [Oscillospiraceae bacterium]